MPRYDYECPEGHVEEIQAKIGQAPDHIECFKCDKTMRRSFRNLNVAGRVEGGTDGGIKIGRLPTARK